MTTPIRASKKRALTTILEALASPAIREDSVPTMLDEVQILWMIGDQKVWWNTQVLDSTEHKDGAQVGYGTIRYKKFRKYKAETVEVTFCWTENLGPVLRHKHDGGVEEVLLSWRYLGQTDLRDSEFNVHAPKSDDGGPSTTLQSFSGSHLPTIIAIIREPGTR